MHISLSLYIYIYMDIHTHVSISIYRSIYLSIYQESPWQYKRWLRVLCSIEYRYGEFKVRRYLNCCKYTCNIFEYI